MKSVKYSFSIITITILLSIVGCCATGFLSINKNPIRNTTTLNVAFSWNNAQAEVIEREVTSAIEGLSATIKGVENITSTSREGTGNVSITIDKYTDIKKAKFELSSLLRAAFKKFPEGVSMPIVIGGASTNKNDTNDNVKPLLHYTIVGKGSSYYLQKFAKHHFYNALMDLNGVSSVDFSGGATYELALTFNKEKLKNHNLEISDISKAVNSNQIKSEIGFGTELDKAGIPSKIFIELKNEEHKNIDWDLIPVKKVGNRTIYLGDIVTTQYREQDQKYFRRINGLNPINMTILGGHKIVKEVKQIVNELEHTLPEGYSLILERDETEFVNNEINTIVNRIFISVLFLLIFTMIITRSWRYLLLVLIGLIANIFIAFIFYYSLNIQIHTYSLAGITISFGIMIDNVIVMLDHLKHKKNLNVFMAILAATLTTVGVLSVIFFLDEELKLLLIDFALVIIINIAISLVVALFLMPALYSRYPVLNKKQNIFFKRQRSIVKWNQFYIKLINFSLLKKRWIIAILILSFGIPAFLLPARLNGNGTMEKMYNSIFSSKMYGQIKPVVDYTLGGTLRMFIQKQPTYSRNMNSSELEGQTQIDIRISMPLGSTVEHTDIITKKFENYIAQFKEVFKFISTGRDANANITVYFKKVFNEGTFPIQLEKKLIKLATETGGCDVSVKGKGKGFSNVLQNENLNANITITGYNYDATLGFAENAKTLISKQQRAKKVRINTGQRVYNNRLWYEFVMSLKKEKLIQKKTTPIELLSNLNTQTFLVRNLRKTRFDDDYIPVNLRPEVINESDVWAVNHALNNKTRLKNVGSLVRENSKGFITKENQQYKVSVDYNFIGNYRLEDRISTKIIDTLNLNFPLGYKASKGSQYYGWNKGQSNQKNNELIVLVILIVYFICAILLESLIQPLVIVLMIPISFIGIFLTFSLFGYNFDAGGYASFLLTSGLIVNSSIYIYNDYNNSIKRASKNYFPITHYIKAYNTKIIPVLLTIISSIIGFLPFLLTVSKEPFWDALAAGTIGGLLFSIPALIVFLPLFLLWKTKVEINKPLISETK